MIYVEFSTTDSIYPHGTIWDTEKEIEITGNGIITDGEIVESGDIEIIPFPLENIDKMREDILKESQLGTQFKIEDSINHQYHNYLPYSKIVGSTSGVHNSYNLFSQNGLALKTYQSDMFNNWLQTEWISGVNGIAAVTAVDTSEGNFKIDALNLANKVYDMLNQIAVSGGTYEDWQESVYGEEAMRRAETPIYCGGMSSEIVFEEVISTADTSTCIVTGKQIGRAHV